MNNRFMKYFAAALGACGLIAAGVTLLTTNASANEYVAMIDEYPKPPAPPPPPQYELTIDRSTYTMDVTVDGQFLEERRVIVGRPGRSTPLVETEFSHIELNPTWDVPKSLVDDMVRKFKRKEDPIGYIKRLGYYFIGPNGNEMAPEEIDWTTISDTGPYEFKLKQKPGPLNMLGQVMFVLKDTGGVQMHGTSTPNLFEKDVRRFSSGCIRVDGANDLAAMLLDKTPDEFDKYRSELGNKWIKLETPVKVKVVE